MNHTSNWLFIQFFEKNKRHKFWSCLKDRTWFIFNQNFQIIICAGIHRISIKNIEKLKELNEITKTNCRM